MGCARHRGCNQNAAFAQPGYQLNYFSVDYCDETLEWEMEVYDQNQTLKEKKTKLKGRSVEIQTANWKEGVYLVRVKYKNEILTGKLVVKK